MNIIWKRPDGGVAVTILTNEGLQAMQRLALEDGFITEAEQLEINDACTAHARQLQERGDIPADYECVAVNIELPESRVDRESWAWRTSSPVIDIRPA